MKFTSAAMALGLFAIAFLYGDAQTKGPLPRMVGFHPVRLDGKGNILPWASADPGTAYDKTLNLVWFYWAHVPPYWDIQPERVVDGVKVPSLALGCAQSAEVHVVSYPPKRRVSAGISSRCCFHPGCFIINTRAMRR